MKTTKNRTKKVSETFLGTISSLIVGIQYYDGKVQGALWESVDSMLHDLDVTSETSDMAKLYMKRQDLIGKYSRKIKLPNKARVVIFMSANRLLGLDLFDSHGTLKKYWKKISESYFIEASRGTEKEKRTKKTTVSKFIADI